MPNVTDYNSLGKAIQDFSHRQDLSSYQDYFIQGAQEALLNDLYDLNFGNGIKQQEVSYPPTVMGASGTVPIPADWGTPKYFTIADNGGNVFTLVFKDPQWIYDRYPVRQATGLPAYIARDAGGVFIFGPYPDSAYTIQGVYYGIAPILSIANPNNWMTASCPLALHAYCMVEAAKFLENDTALARWQAVAQARLKAVVDSDKAERFAAATMQIEIG